MKAKLINIDNQEVGSIDLEETIFSVAPKKEILNLVVNWQRSKKQAGTHSTKGRSDVSGTTRKPHKQKGTGKARLGSLRAVQCRGGGIAFGPVVRSHEFSVPKKVRKLALRMALSAKLLEGKIIFLDDIKISEVSTKKLYARLNGLFLRPLLVIHDDFVDADNFIKSSANIAHIDVMPEIGANVYDLLRHEYIVVTKQAVKTLEGRLK